MIEIFFFYLDVFPTFLYNMGWEVKFFSLLGKWFIYNDYNKMYLFFFGTSHTMILLG